jgi:hypothetical protein
MPTFLRRRSLFFLWESMGQLEQGLDSETGFGTFGGNWGKEGQYKGNGGEVISCDFLSSVGVPLDQGGRA